jgi:ABC-2 type transport system ATP-binding protein
MQSHPPAQPVRTADQAARPGSRPGPTTSRPDPTSARPAIEALGLVKTYPAPGKNPRIRALDGLDLTVAPGTIYALVGPNGAGKSTTVKILTTLAIADEGTAAVEGIDVRTDPARVRRVIGVVGQRSGADPAATGRENLILQGHLYGQPTVVARRRADELLERVALSEAACSAASTSRSAWCTGRRSCSSTSRPPGSTRRRGQRCGTRSPGWPNPTG